MSSIQQCRPLLGTYVKVLVRGEQTEDQLLAHSLRVFAEIERIQGLMSFHDPDSELSRINAQAHRRPLPLSDEMQEVLSLALQLGAQTAGRFDLSIASDLVRLGVLPDHRKKPDRAASWRDIHLVDGTVFFARPLQIDLGGIAKGYAVDRGLAQLDEGVQAIINAGGDLRMSHWQDELVEIRIPATEPDNAGFVQLPMQAPAMATSAPTPGCHHPVVSPATHQPLADPRSVSVFAPRCMVADALAKAVFLTPDCEPLLAHYAATAVVVTPQAETTFLGLS